jgi:hypothetical protein
VCQPVLHVSLLTIDSSKQRHVVKSVPSSSSNLPWKPMAAEGARDGQSMAVDVRLEGSGPEVVQAQRVRMNTSRAKCVASHSGITEWFSNECFIKICVVSSSNLFAASRVQVSRSEGILLKSARFCDCHRDKGLAGWLVEASLCLSKRTKHWTSLLLVDHRLLR